MSHNRLARGTALAAATLSGLGLFCLCLGTVSAQGPTAGTLDATVAQIWHVNIAAGEGLVGYWKFDQAFDSRTFNSALLANQTVLTGGSSITTAVPATVTVPDFGALELDGINGAAVISDAMQLDVSRNSFSVAAWVRRVFTGTHTADLIYDSGTQTGHWYFGFLKNDKLTFTTNGIQDFSSPFTVTDSNWHHVAAVVSGSVTNNLTIYLDGMAAPVISATITNDPSGPKLVGNKNGPLNTPFDGDIDEVRLYNRALSSAEVSRLAAGRGCVTDGTTWPKAFGDLQCALDVAANGDQVWLAQGTYRPGTAREVSFHLLKDLSLLGGFNGTESSPAQRPPFDPNAPLTVLSGDAAGNDGPGFTGYDDNACSVVTTGSNLLPGFVISATFDRLAIVDGNARCSFPQSSNGGGLHVLSARQLSFDNVVFQANKANGVGGGLALGGGLLTITASSFVSNTASQGGGIGIDAGQGHTIVAVSNSDFTGDQAQDGGAVWDQVGDGLLELSFDQVHFTGNLSLGGDGGAVSNSAVDPGVIRTRFSQATFTGNSAQADGGAISDFGGELSIDGSQFTGNSSPFSTGGALEARSVVTVTNSTFLSNTARTGGGALLVLGTLTLVDSSVNHNAASDSGGSDFALVGGGAFVSGTAIITDTHFISNTAFLQGVVFGNNLAEGGGLAVTGNLVLSGGDFRDNSAEHGAGVYVLGSALIQRSVFQHNSAGSGGGVFADGDLNLVNNRLVDNTALESLTNEPSIGGGLLLQNGTFNGKVSDNLFLDNTALCLDNSCTPHGSALSVDGFATLVSNNTIVSRDLITVSAASVTGTTGLFNNIITSHTVAIEALGGVTFDDYNLFHANSANTTGAGISHGGHSRSADPRFVDPALDNYQLRLTSPAIDAGDNSRVPAIVTTDLAGGPRFVDIPAVPDTGAGTPPLVDIGAFETAAKSLFLPVIRK